MRVESAKGEIVGRDEESEIRVLGRFGVLIADGDPNHHQMTRRWIAGLAVFVGLRPLLNYLR